MLNKIKIFGKAFATKVASKSPVICAVAGVALTGGALVMMNKQTKKREEILDKYIQTRKQQIFDKAVKSGKYEVESIEDVRFTKDDFTFKDKAKLFVKTYGVPVTMYLAGMGLSVTAVALLSKRLAAAAISPVATTAIGCTNEVIADKARKTVDEKLHGPEAERYRPKVIPGTGVEQAKGGTDRFYNTWDGRWFNSDTNTVKSAILEASEALLDEESGIGAVTFSNIYDNLNLTRSVSNDVDGFPAGSPIDYDFEIRTLEDDTPYTAIIWKTEPERLV